MSLTNPYQYALDILQQAAEKEQDARRFYLDAAGQTGDPRGQDMYRFLADEEALHLRVVQIQIKALSEGQGWVASPEVQPAAFQPMPTLFQSPREKLRERIRPDDRDLDALIVALEIEDLSFKGYSQAHEQTSDSLGKQILGYLAHAEQNHFNLVMQNYESLLYQQHWQGLGL